MPRPYQSLTADDLKSLSADPSLHPAIIHELSFRRTAKARSLLRELGGQPNASEVSDVYREKYEALRATMTEAGELLAQWGMTETLPSNIIELVLVEWSKLISQIGFRDRRTQNDLDELRSQLIRLGVLNVE